MALRLNQNGFFSKTFYRVHSLWTGIQIEPGFADFRLFDRRVIEAIRRYATEEIFLRGLVLQLGFREVTLPYSCERRRYGETKYIMAKNLRLALRGLGFLTPGAAMAVGSSLVLLVLGIFWVYLRRMYLRLAVNAPAYIVGESSDEIRDASSSVTELRNRAS